MSFWSHRCECHCWSSWKLLAKIPLCLVKGQKTKPNNKNQPTDTKKPKNTMGGGKPCFYFSPAVPRNWPFPREKMRDGVRFLSARSWPGRWHLRWHVGMRLARWLTGTADICCHARLCPNSRRGLSSPKSFWNMLSESKNLSKQAQRSRESWCHSSRVPLGLPTLASDWHCLAAALLLRQ